MGRTRFLCDSCKYDYDGACTRPERPNAIRCADYAPVGRAAAPQRPRQGARLRGVQEALANLLRALGRPFRAVSSTRGHRSKQASRAVDALFDELNITVAPDSTGEQTEIGDPPTRKSKRPQEGDDPKTPQG